MAFGHSSWDTFGASTIVKRSDASMLTGYEKITSVDGIPMNFKSIQESFCPNKTGGDETCIKGPFTQLTIRGESGQYAYKNGGRWFWGSNNTLFLNDYDGNAQKSGALEIDIRDDYVVKMKISLKDPAQGKKFKDEKWAGIVVGYDGVLSKDALNTTVLMKGGDKLSIDIDNDWSGTTFFFLKVNGTTVASSPNSTYLVNDEVQVTLLEVWKKIEATDDDSGDDSDDSDDSDDGTDDTGSGNGDDDGTDDGTDDGADDGTDYGIWPEDEDDGTGSLTDDGTGTIITTQTTGMQVQPEPASKTPLIIVGVLGLGAILMMGGNE